MTSAQISAALAAANPLTDEAAEELALGAAEFELIGQIIATSVSARPSVTRVKRYRRRQLVLLTTATVAAACVLALLPSGPQGGDGGPPPAFAAALVRFANASPLVLLKLPGWHVVYADEQPGGIGELHFVRGLADAQGNPRGASVRNPASLVGRAASLTWGPVEHVSPENHQGGNQTVVTGLGVTVRRFIREGRGRGWVDVSALFVDDGRGLEFRATVTDMGMFYAELRALRAVNPNTWLRAMPASVVKSADSGQTIRLMLEGIPLPPGFDAAHIRGARLVHDRYQLGVAVTGTVACMWIADWSRARDAGNTAEVNRAIAAMATAPRWAILHAMARRGAWSQVLIGFAKAMPTGTWFGRPLVPYVNSGLGCNEWGVTGLGSLLAPGAPRPVRRAP